MGRISWLSKEATIDAAVSGAYGDLQDLRNEIDEVVTSAEGGRAATQRIQTLGEAVDHLSNCEDEPDVPQIIGKTTITWQEIKPQGRRAYLSRASRRDNAQSALQAVVDYINCADEPEDEVEELKTTLEEFIGEVTEAEFPGAFT